MFIVLWHYRICLFVIILRCKRVFVLYLTNFRIKYWNVPIGALTTESYWAILETALNRISWPPEWITEFGFCAHMSGTCLVTYLRVSSRLLSTFETGRKDTFSFAFCLYDNFFPPRTCKLSYFERFVWKIPCMIHKWGGRSGNRRLCPHRQDRAPRCRPLCRVDLRWWSTSPARKSGNWHPCRRRESHWLLKKRYKTRLNYSCFGSSSWTAGGAACPWTVGSYCRK